MSGATTAHTSTYTSTYACRHQLLMQLQGFITATCCMQTYKQPGPHFILRAPHVCVAEVVVECI